MRTTPANNWPVAEGSDPLKQYPAAVDQPFKDDLDTKVAARFANAAARDAAIPSPTEGRICWLLDLHQQQAYYGGWKPVGGRLPFYECTREWGGSSVPIGFSVLTAASGNVVSQQGGGMTDNGDGSVTIATAGVYHIETWVDANLTAGALGASWGARTWSISAELSTTWSGGNGGPRALHTRTKYLTAGTQVAPWMYAYSAATLYYHRFTVEWVSM